MGQYPNEHSFRGQLKAASLLQRKEDLNVFSYGDEENSSEEDVEEQFNKLEFINKFYAELMQLMNQLAGEPTGSRCSKPLCEKKAVPPPKPAHKTVHKLACKCMPTHTTNHGMCLWCSDAPEHPQYPLGTMQAVKNDQRLPQRDAMDNNAATTRLLHLLHMGPGLDGNKCTPFQGVHPPLGTVKRPPVHSGPHGSCACHTATMKSRCL